MKLWMGWITGMMCIFLGACPSTKEGHHTSKHWSFQKSLSSPTKQTPQKKTKANNTNQQALEKLVKAYPDFLAGYQGDTLIWKDGTKMLFDDGVQGKGFEAMLRQPDLQEQMWMPYPKGKNYTTPQPSQDPGRIRYLPFFKKMYGHSAEEVWKNVVTVAWMPNVSEDKIQVTRINGIDQKVRAISKELEKYPHLYPYVQSPAGGFHWRKIAGTQRLGAHSFGIAIDINITYSDYWRWQKSDKQNLLPYKNRIPLEIVAIFEKYGFIWGGKWYHYDTMHFEYRPELLQ